MYRRVHFASDFTCKTLKMPKVLGTWDPIPPTWRRADVLMMRESASRHSLRVPNRYPRKNAMPQRLNHDGSDERTTASVVPPSSTSDPLLNEFIDAVVIPILLERLTSSATGEVPHTGPLPGGENAHPAIWRKRRRVVNGVSPLICLG